MIISFLAAQLLKHGVQRFSKSALKAASIGTSKAVRAEMKKGVPMESWTSYLPVYGTIKAGVEFFRKGGPLKSSWKNYKNAKSLFEKAEKDYIKQGGINRLNKEKAKFAARQAKLPAHKRKQWVQSKEGEAKIISQGESAARNNINQAWKLSRENNYQINPKAPDQLSEKTKKEMFDSIQRMRDAQGKVLIQGARFGSAVALPGAASLILTAKMKRHKEIKYGGE
jgi:hypothetical protein